MVLYEYLLSRKSREIFLYSLVVTNYFNFSYVQFISKLAVKKQTKPQQNHEKSMIKITTKLKQNKIKITTKSKHDIFENMHTMCSNLQIRSDKLKCRVITSVYYDMREILGYMVNIYLAFFSRENIFPQKAIIWIMFGF